METWEYKILISELCAMLKVKAPQLDNLNEQEVKNIYDKLNKEALN